MWQRATSNEIWAKALRVVLVFSLVFWVSFRVECLAFAALLVDDVTEHSGDELTGMTVYEILGYGSDDMKLGQSVGATGESLDARDYLVSSNKGRVHFGAVPSWRAVEKTGDDPDDSDKSGDSEKPGTNGGKDDDSQGGNGGKDDQDGQDGEGSQGGQDGEGGSGSGDDDNGEYGDDGESPGNSVQPAPPASNRASLEIQADGEDVVVADFVKWEIAEGGDFAELSVDEQNGVATLVGKNAGTVIVKCTLQDFAKDYVARDFDGAFEVQFKVTVKDPYVDSLKIYQPPYSTEAEPCEDNQEIVLSDSERESYAFWAKAHVTDEAAAGEYSFESREGHLLSKVSDGMLSDLVWEVLDESGKDPADDDVATIDAKTGKLTLKGDGPVMVRCTAAEGLSGDPLSAQVIVRSDKEKPDEKEDIQGASHPQSTLTVVVDDPYAPAADEGSEKESSGEGEGIEADDGADTPDATSDDSAGEDTDDAAGKASGSSESSDASSRQPAQTTKVFVADDDGSLVELKDQASGERGDPLGALTETYTMNTIEGGSTTVEGRGSNLAMLLDAVGVGVDDQTRIESIDFISAESEPVNIAWSDLVSVSRGYIMIAAKSFVHEYNGETSGFGNEEGKAGSDEDPSADAQDDDSADGDEAGAGDDGGGEGAAGEGSGAAGGDGDDSGAAGEGDDSGAAGEGEGASGSAKLLDNTRFRILYQAEGSNIDPMKLRYINQIIVHMGEPEDSDLTDPELDIHIDYVPVPYGKEAFLSAVPNNKVGASRFGYTWQISTDGGKQWDEYSSESVQTLRVSTTNPPEGHVGHLFRVILETDLKNEDGSARGATSDPVTITASDEFSIVLDYIPPIAGQNANFTSHLYNTSGIDLSKLTYVWEANSGDGWFVVPGSGNSPTWSTPTNAVDESAESSDDADATAIMTYIRVRVTTSEGKTATSNVQPLTVRVGEDSGEKKADDINDALNQDTDGDDDSADDGDTTDSNDTQDKPKKKKKKITEIPSVTVEDTPSTMADYLDGNQTIDPTVAGDTPEVVINQDVTAKINEQNNAAKEKSDSTKPGARWRELNTLNPSDEDVQRIFADNPFAPFAIPLGLGVVFAGGLEKLLAFRRQL